MSCVGFAFIELSSVLSNLSDSSTRSSGSVTDVLAGILAARPFAMLGNVESLGASGPPIREERIELAMLFPFLALLEALGEST